MSISFVKSGYCLCIVAYFFLCEVNLWPVCYNITFHSEVSLLPIYHSEVSLLPVCCDITFLCEVSILPIYDGIFFLY